MANLNVAWLGAYGCLPNSISIIIDPLLPSKLPIIF